MTLEHRKIDLIQQIAASSQEDFINAIDEVVKSFAKLVYRLDLSKHSNIKEKIDIEEIKRERPLINFEMDEFIQETDSLEWDKSIDELLRELD